MKSTFILLIFSIFSSIHTWKPIFVGHRGSYTGIENSVESYTAGVEKYGYTGLECDVRVTKDNYYVISHDESIKGDKGEMVITQHTLAELKSNQMTKTRGGITYHGVICTVEEYLKICHDKGAFPMMELKWTKGINNEDMSMFDGLAKLVEKYELGDKVVFLTSMKKSIEFINENYSYSTQYLMYTLNDERLEFLRKTKSNASILVSGVTQETVDRIKKENLDVAAWVVNDKETYLKLAKLGVFMVTCDYLYPKDMPDVEPPKTLRKNFLGF